jgi:NAD(P)H-dependent FMN reductase
MTRLLLVSGSASASSANRAVLEEVARLAPTLGAHAGVEWSGPVGALPPFQPDLVDDPPSAVVDFRGQLERADAVVIAAPEYAGGVAGSTKNALDWCVGSASVYRRPVAVASAGTSGGQHAQAQLVRTLLWQGAHVVASLGVAGPKTKSDASGRITDETTLAEIELLASTLLTAIDETPVERVVRVRELAARFGVDPGQVHDA